MSEVQAALADPAAAIALAMGPPFPELVPQRPGSGLVVGNRPVPGPGPARFVFKKAHMSREDYRVFNASGHVVAVLHHFGKNPYDKLGAVSGYAAAHDNRMGEWESLCHVSGYNGMPGLRVRPKNLSRHGRQYVSDGAKRVLFNVGKESKLKNLALRSNLAVRRGEGKDVVYRVLPDLMGRTFQVVNEEEQLVCFVQKSTKALIMNAALGAGSEMVIDVAPGVDWTAMVAVIMALQQVGAHIVKDALGNFVLEPLKDSAVQTALQGSGMEGAAAGLGANVDSALHFMHKAQAIHRMFTQ